MKRAVILAALLLTALGAVAQGLDKYKGWADSPEGYFLTAAERTQWSAVTSDEEAEKFVASFRERRGGEKFAKEVANRAAMADKYLTIGKLKGSQTLRGKLVILFGPPANIEVNDRSAVRKGYTPGAAAGVTDLGVSHTVENASGSEQKLGEASVSGKMFRDFTFTFAPAASFGGKELKVTVEADAGTGKDRLAPKGLTEADLNSIFENVAQASIAKQ